MAVCTFGNLLAIKFKQEYSVRTCILNFHGPIGHGVLCEPFQIIVVKLRKQRCLIKLKIKMSGSCQTEKES